jgi:hypothetical protein
MNSFPLAIAVLTLLAHAPAVYSQDLFLMAAFDQTPDIATVKWLEQQTEQIFSEAGLTLAWVPRKQLNGIPVGALPVWVQFHGACRVEPAVLPALQEGPMGWVRSQDGEIRPLIDIDCNRTSAMVWQHRGTLPLPLVVRSFGRALGRVVAHELYHYLTQSVAHTQSDIFRHEMTSQDLTRPEVRLEPSEIEALRRAVSPRDEVTQASERTITD